MELFFRKVGAGHPVILLHGVFGSSDNLFTVSKKIAEAGFEVFLIDARNHGQSPRSNEFNYQVMSQDLAEFIEKHQLDNPYIIGHSMGGKTTMWFAQNYNNFGKIVLVDIAPRFYPTHHNHILAGLSAINLDLIKNRKEAEDIFSNYVDDLGEKQFILKNLYRKEDGTFDWRINVPVISENIYLIGEEISMDNAVNIPTLVIRGSESSYVSDEDFEEIKKGFPLAQLETIEGANHWVHATKPDEFVQALIDFFNQK